MWALIVLCMVYNKLLADAELGSFGGEPRGGPCGPGYNLG